MLSEAQAQYYRTAGDRASKDSYLDMYQKAVNAFDKMEFKPKKALLAQILGKEPTNEQLNDATLRDKMIHFLAMQYAEMEQIPAIYMAKIDQAKTRAAPPDPVSDARIMQFGNTLIGS